MGLAYSLSHNSIKCLLFILKFTFHSLHWFCCSQCFSTKCLFYLHGRHHIRCFFGGRLLTLFKCSFHRFFDWLNAWTGILFFFVTVINIEFKTKVLLQSSTKGGHLVLVPDAGGKQSEGGICCYICNHLRMKKNSFTALNSSVIHQF